MVDVPESARLMLGFLAARRPDEAHDPEHLWRCFGTTPLQFVDAVDDLHRHGYIRSRDVVLPEGPDGHHGSPRTWTTPAGPRNFRRMGITRGSMRRAATVPAGTGTGHGEEE